MNDAAEDLPPRPSSPQSHCNKVSSRPRSPWESTWPFADFTKHEPRCEPRFVDRRVTSTSIPWRLISHNMTPFSFAPFGDDGPDNAQSVVTLIVPREVRVPGET